MTYEEAKMQIQAIPEKIWDQLSEPDREAMEMAFSALEKQIPNKPYTNVIHYPYTSDLTTVQCPNCKRRLRTRRTQAKGDRFCPDCGQAIDWEGE